MDTTLSRLQPGQLLDGRYRVGSWLARGGMATVYLGTDTKLDRTVALKVAHPELLGDRDFVRRFSTEARAAARMSSANVVAVYDTGSEGGLLYLVMEYVPGRTLRELLIERGRLAPAEALEIFRSVLTGLAAAHRAGIVHRDVKPENVLIGSSGAVKVADFGLARAASLTSHTRTGMIIGTAAYLAPEQVAHSTADERSDVYASGVMLFEMLTGTQPHKGQNALAVAHKHVSEVVPAPSSRVRGLPRSLDALVAMATSRDPALRPADAGVFLRAVTEASRELERMLMAQTGAMGDRTSDGDRTAALGTPQRSSPSGDSWFPWSSSGENVSPAYGGRRDGPTSHTLIVRDDDHVSSPSGRPPRHPDRRGGGDRRPAEPFLQRLLFSRRFVYSALAVAVVAIIAVVTWWVSDGQYTTIPPVNGIAGSTARTELGNLGFTVQVGKGVHSALTPGEVVRTEPAAGTSVHRGAVITLIESLGPLMISVPQVTGQQQAAAEAALKQAGLKVGKVTKTASATVPAGEVVSTNPTAGTSWPQTKPVDLTVSEGPPLPDFTNEMFSDAQAQAEQGGYVLQQTTAPSSGEPQGTIVGQSPAPGTPITPGEVVTVQVSAGPPEVNIPTDLIGEPVDQATQELQALGFQVKVKQGLFGGNTVQSYSPTGQAPAGSTITLNLGGLGFP